MRNIFHFRSFLNFLERNKLFTAINVFGFAVSLMFVILLGLYVQDELAVDQFHADKERIFRFEAEDGSGSPPPLADMLQGRYPEIEATLRMASRNDVITDFNGERMGVEVQFADSTFFDFFSFRSVEGDPRAALATPQHVVLSLSTARKLFGDTSALGRTVKLGFGVNQREYVVTGVMEDVRNSHLSDFGLMLNFREMVRYWGEQHYTGMGNSSFPLYLKVRRGSDLSAKVPDMLEYLKETFWMYRDGYAKELKLNRLDRIYLSRTEGAAMCEGHNSPKTIAVMGIVAFLVLTFAAINYINLSVVQSEFRAHEAAMRRLLGGTEKQLFFGFIIESVMMCVISLVLALLLASLAEDWFRQTLDTDVALVDLLTWPRIVVCATGVVVLGILTGLVPATVISRFGPIEVVRGTLQRRTKMVYGKILIVFQYVITIILIGCTLTVILQTRYMRVTDLGFRHSKILVLDNILSDDKLAGIRDRLMTVSGVDTVAFSYGLLGDEGMSFRTVDGKSHSFRVMRGSKAFVDVMGYTVLRRTSGMEYPFGVWLNEAGWRDLELTEGATEYKLAGGDGVIPIRGVLKDFHSSSLAEEIEPLMITSANVGYLSQIVVRLKEGCDAYAVRGEVCDAYEDYNGGVPFGARFMDQMIEEWYQSERTLARLVGALTVLAVIISALGMLAMSTYFMRQRAQEVAVRKVFGATGHEVLTRLVMSFLRLVLVAFVVAVPVIWYLMSGWLGGYAYRISLSWTIFAVAGGSAFVIAFVTVLWQSLKVTRANPILAIKD